MAANTMLVRAYVYMCTYMYFTYVLIYEFIYTNVYINIFMYISINTHICICMQVVIAANTMRACVYI
jgi:hypothetical protein